MAQKFSAVLSQDAKWPVRTEVVEGFCLHLKQLGYDKKDKGVGRIKVTYQANDKPSPGLLTRSLRTLYPRRQVFSVVVFEGVGDGGHDRDVVVTPSENSRGLGKLAFSANETFAGFLTSEEGWCAACS